MSAWAAPPVHPSAEDTLVRRQTGVLHPNVNEAMGVKAIETIGVLKTECQDNWVSENVPFTLLVRLFDWPFKMGKRENNCSAFKMARAG